MPPLGALASLAAALTSLEAPVFALSLHVFALTLTVVLPNARRMFGPRYARRHRAAGAAYLALLLVGALDLVSTVARDRTPPRLPHPAPRSLPSRFAYDVALGVGGTILTLTAAQDFKGAHDERRVRNVASGALDEDQTVTREEMLEHAFYQLLNLAQALFLHASVRFRSPSSSPAAAATRALALAAVTAPWLARDAFPVNRFSHNYTRPGRDPRGVTSRMYRAKKWQYVALKHALQHGLNVSVAVCAASSSPSAGDTGTGLMRSIRFRTHWLAMNAAFVLEFFTQTLVKRGYLSQRKNLAANVWLMCAASAAAAGGAADAVRAHLAIASTALNFARPGREMANVALVAAVGVATDGSWPPGWIVAFAGASILLAHVERRLRAASRAWRDARRDAADARSGARGEEKRD
jgi:hypothetical protein